MDKDLDVLFEPKDHWYIRDPETDERFYWSDYEKESDPGLKGWIGSRGEHKPSLWERFLMWIGRLLGLE